MRTPTRKLLWFIVVLTLMAIVVDLPKDFQVKFTLGNIKVDRIISAPNLNINLGPLQFSRDLAIKEGLDLAGGTHLVLSADMKDIKPADRNTALASAANIISRRVNLYGVSEPVVQTARTGQDYRIIVELPGVKNIDQAISLVGQTARLDFREFKNATASAMIVPTLENTIDTKVTGKDLQSAQADFDPQSGAPVVSFTMTGDGAVKFAALTKKLLNKPLAIFLDNMPISWPTVNAVISQNGVITGNFTTEQTKQLALQLNAGALPVPIKIIEQRNVGATLGSQSVHKSVIAGAIGLFVVAMFMLLNYGKMGFMADLALLIYSLLTLALFKLIPVTLTLAGIAGFILSIGMAVDANILIFERTKEEKRWGKNDVAAIELGFNRAFPSIRDSNASTLITCAVLYWFGTGIIRGFALTLAVGVLVSLFSAITVTRTFLRLFYRQK
ncbi:MAG: protein translocase subunit SecD [Patescibacteria group bacterium]|nr:protein translocase subunit SecD [Patescibacteria group bacterium]